MTDRTTDRPPFTSAVGFAALGLSAFALSAGGCRYLSPRPAMPLAPAAPVAPVTPVLPADPAYPAYPAYPTTPGGAQPLYPTPDPAFNAAPGATAPDQTFTARPPGSVPGTSDQLVPTPVDPPASNLQPEPDAGFSGPRLIAPEDLQPPPAARSLPADQPRPTDSRPADNGLTGNGPAGNGPGGNGPSVAIEGIVVPARVDLEVSAVPTCQVGADCVFNVTLRNTGDRPTGPLTVEAEFDSALVFPGRSDKRVKRPTAALAAHGTEGFTLTLRPDAAGVHCARFTVSGEGVTPITKQVCVSCEAGPQAGR